MITGLHSLPHRSLPDLARFNICTTIAKANRGQLISWKFAGTPWCIDGMNPCKDPVQAGKSFTCSPLHAFTLATLHAEATLVWIGLSGNVQSHNAINFYWIYSTNHTTVIVNTGPPLYTPACMSTIKAIHHWKFDYCTCKQKPSGGPVCSLCIQ